MGKKHKKHKHVSRQEQEAPGFGDRSRSEMRVVLQLPHTVQVGHAQEAPDTNELLVSIPLDALRPQSPSEEPEPYSSTAERSVSAERRHHKHKKHKKNKRHHDGHKEADKRFSGDLFVSVDDSSPPPVPLKFSYKLQPSPPRLPPPPPLPAHSPEPSGHSKSGKLRHVRAGETSEVESPVAMQVTAERVTARSGKPTSLAGLASRCESEPQRQKKKKHKRHQHQEDDDASPTGGSKAAIAPLVLGKEVNASKKVKLEVLPSQPSAPLVMDELAFGVSRNTAEPRMESKTSAEVPVATHRVRLVPAEVPVATHRAPLVPAEVPVATHRVPLVPAEVPVATHRVPLVPAEVPVAIHRAPLVPAEVPVATHRVPLVPAEVPVATHRAPSDLTRTRSSSVTSNSFSFPSRPPTPPGQSDRPITPTSAIRSTPTPPQVKLPANLLKAFLRDLQQQIAKRDPEGIFAEPVTDDIAPGYSAIISHPLDLKTILKKIETNAYSSVNEFRDDFELMCNNAMTYNTPDTVYYASAKRLLTFGLKLIAKESSLRPDVCYGVVHQPPAVHLPAPSSARIDYSSPWLCRISLQAMSGGGSQPSPSAIPSITASDQNEVVDIGDEGTKREELHLTTVQVGLPEEEDDSEDEWPGDEEDEGVAQVMESCEALEEEEMESTELPEFCFLNSDERGKTFLNVVNPDIGAVTSTKPIDLSFLSDRVKMGDNAATLLQSELAMYKATPVSYLMFGPFGSFAPVFDSTFATLTKQDSDLLLTAYGNDTGVSYAHSLQQFVKDTGSFVSEMAQALLNGLTGGRHRKLLEATELKGKEQVSGKRGGVEQAEGDSVGGARSIGEADPTEDDTVELVSASSGTVAERLQQTSQMIANLYQQQLGRLSQFSAVGNENLYGSQLLPEKELGTAQAVAMGLASLTSQLQPQDVVSLQAVRQAMGVAPFVPQPQDVYAVKNSGIDE